MTRTSSLLIATGLSAIAAVAACGGDDGDDDAATPDSAILVDSPPVTPDAPVDADLSPRPVTLRFAPMVGTVPFACGQSYAHMGSEDTTITPRDFRFYATGVELLGPGNARTPVTLDQDDWQYQSVALLDFENFTGGCQDGTPATNLTIRGMAPPGAYTGVAFTVGVPEELNHEDLIEVPSPLNLTSLYWSWNLGHVFFAAVSHTDITAPTPGTNDHYVHVGSTGCTGDGTTGEPITCTKANRPHVELTGFDPTTGTIEVDYGAVLAADALTTSEGCHSFEPDACTAAFTNVGVEFATGHAMATQSVFRTRP